MSGRQTTSVLLYSQHSTPTGCVANKLFSMCRMFIVFGTLLKKNLVKRKKCFFFLLPARANGVWRMSNNKWKWGCKLKRSISSRDSRNDGFFLQLKRVPKSSVVPWWNKKKKMMECVVKVCGKNVFVFRLYWRSRQRLIFLRQDRYSPKAWRIQINTGSRLYIWRRVLWFTYLSAFFVTMYHFSFTMLV